MSVRPCRGLVQAALMAAAAVAGFGSFELSARAQSLTNAPIDLQMFRPAMDSKGFITLNSSETLGEGDVSFGQYRRIMGMNFALGAGSQLVSLALPGESAWR